MPWNPDRYHQFQAQRAAPFDDLVALIKIHEGLRVIDLGCGTGELTRKLADRLPNSDLIGLDSSPEMLQRAAEHARPGLRFERGSIETAVGSYDLVFSHAAIHWVDDHPVLIPRLLSMVTPGGQLTVQMPSNHNHPTHRLITELAGQEPFRQALGGWTRHSPVLAIDEYATILYESGAEDITIFEKVYPHILADADAMADWTSGTALVPYFERLTDELRDQFMAEYRRRLRELWPNSPVFYGFRRTLFAATRP